MFDKFHEECGVFGIFGHEDASRLAYLGLYALQHRGQESAGIVSSDGKKLFAERGMGQVSDVFPESVMARLPGDLAIGHVPSRSIAALARSRSATTATSRTQARRAGNWRLMGRSFHQPRTRKSCSIAWHAQRTNHRSSVQ
jgi:glutamine phosphoribosylpyrophosphate amidotransferase